jgi:hypothetical protein
MQYKMQIRAEQIRPGEKIVPYSDSLEVVGFTRRPHEKSRGNRDSDWIVLQKRVIRTGEILTYDAYLASEMIDVIVERDDD